MSLFVVATPIGNLEDVTFRAVRVLNEVEVIACEDTRQTLKLLARYNIHKTLISYYQPKEAQRIHRILSLLEDGKDVALVSDSGTPGISDPGFRLIREAIKRGIKIIPVPGPSALIAALSASGLPTDRFLFVGFPSPKKEKVRKWLLSLEKEKATLIFYLPTRRLFDFLSLVEETLGNRNIVVAREISKIHEEFIRGDLRRLSENAGKISRKGEAVVLVQGSSPDK